MRAMSDEATSDEATTIYDRCGGMPFFERLVDRFYRGVETDEVLISLYPDRDDLGPARRRLTLFLGQYWGGPTTYMDERGHPRLRMRHMPFTVGPLQRDRWLVHMTEAVVAETDDPELQAVLLQYFIPAAEHLRNDTGLPISSPSQQ
jgi:hemoglobin